MFLGTLATGLCLPAARLWGRAAPVARPAAPRAPAAMPRRSIDVSVMFFDEKGERTWYALATAEENEDGVYEGLAGFEFDDEKPARTAGYTVTLLRPAPFPPAPGLLGTVRFPRPFELKGTGVVGAFVELVPGGDPDHPFKINLARYV